ncbi:hypothetical protein PSQ19_10875 [Devosia algicola]|uniref:Quercetin 2,3-dioxygenase C-terminal cupin domain-containing protein n=1 Tax=Devosia algicola TaxID=3026418 RepID=A0ABY7YJR8_9HYPH|nr:hypothetical protein [Devosia algicola]WDR01329.1 hypothetical protein PSQ19_10875 [Devosia algicola]
MQIIGSDPTRMIDLPGSGPCPRPVDIDERVTGFSTLKSLRIYTFAKGQMIDGESEGDEVYVVAIGGAVDMVVSGTHPLHVTLSPGDVQALYMTPEHAYKLKPQSHVQVAYARAQASGHVASHAVTGTRGDAAETLRFALVNLLAGDVLDQHLSGERLIHLIAGTVDVDGTTVNAPQTIALPMGEIAPVRARAATQLLVVWV